MHDHGHSTAASGLVIALHVGAMTLPSPLDQNTHRPLRPHRSSRRPPGLTLLAAGVLRRRRARRLGPPLLTLALSSCRHRRNFSLRQRHHHHHQHRPARHAGQDQQAVDVTIAIAEPPASV
ncbi:hypothetical protein LV779_36725 [Streptomyces thinghirensis]|nr:hypothetical protein [Streptomyces thinghirensis]